jgi:Peptidase_C39 like family
MLSVIITALLLGLMLLIIASLLLGTWREQQRHKRTLQTHAQTSTQPLSQHITTTLHAQNGMIVGVEKPKHSPAFTWSSSWYMRRRTLVSLGFLTMTILTLFVQNALADGSLQHLSNGLDFTLLSYSQPQPSDLHPATHPTRVVPSATHSSPVIPPATHSTRVVPLTASQRVVRINSGAADQYATTYEHDVWEYSSCSGIAMEMVMNAYGRHLIASDVLQEELKLGVWNVQLGLLRDEGIAMTAAYFGFNADLSHSRTVQDIVAIANKGQPVIVSVRDAYYFPGGHFMVVRGGDNQYVYLADSSPANFPRMSYSMFLGMWSGLSAILTPHALKIAVPPLHLRTTAK